MIRLRPGVGHGHRGGLVPGGAPLPQLLKGPLGAGLSLRALAPPVMGDRSVEPESTPGRAGRRASEAVFDVLERRRKVVALDRLRRGLDEVRDRPLRLASALEVLGEGDRIALAVALEPLAGVEVSEGPIVVGQGRVGGDPDQVVVKDVLALADELALLTRRDHLVGDQGLEPTIAELGLRPEQRPHPALPEDLTEGRGRAEHLAGADVEALEAGLDHRQHAARQGVPLAVGDRPDQLLEVEHVPRRLLDHPLEQIIISGLAQRVPEHLDDQRPTGAVGERSQLQLGHAPTRPEAREGLMDLGSGEGKHHHRSLQVSQGVVDEGDRRQISPVKILEDQQEHPLGVDRAEVVLPGAPELVGHHLWITPRREELDAGALPLGDAAQLAEEGGHAAVLRLWERRRDRGLELRRAHLRLAVADPERRAQHPSDHAEGGSGAQEIAVGGPDLDVPPRAEAIDELVAQARLAEPRRRGHEHGLGDRLLDRLLQDRLQDLQLPPTADAGRRAPHQGARRSVLEDLAAEVEAATLAAGDLLDREALIQEARRHLVEVDPGARPGSLEHRQGPVEGGAEGSPAARLTAPCRDHDRRVFDRPSQLQSAERRARGLIGRRPAGHQGDEHRPVGEDLDVPAVAARRPPDIDDRRGVLGSLEGRRLLHLSVAVKGLRVRIERAPRGEEENADQPLLAERQRHPTGRRRGQRPGDQGEFGEGSGHPRRVGGATFGVLGEHRVDQLRELRRHVWAQLLDPRRLLQEDLRENRHHVRPLEGRRPCQALVEHDPQGEHVGPHVELADPLRLLGRHVAGGAHEHARLGHRLRPLAETDHPEVDDLHAL